MPYKTLRNTTSAEQWIMKGGTKYTIPPRSEESYEETIAEIFLDQRSPSVVDVTVNKASGQTYAPDLIKETMWVANMTGNPDAPKKIHVNQFSKDVKRVVKVELDNLNAEPRTISEEMKGGHQQYFDSAGLVQISLPSKILEVPPFSRRPFAAGEANFLLQRDGQSNYRGGLIRSRPPTDFEPDMDWTLKDIRAYARLLDDNMDLGVDEDMLGKQAKQENWTDKQAVEKLRQAKQKMLRRLFFRIVDPTYRLPTKKEFNEFVTGKSEEQLAREEVDALIASSNKDARSALNQQRRVAPTPA